MTILDDYQGFIFDMDGTLYRGDELIPGAVKVINHLKEQSFSLLLVTNKTTNSTSEYISFLQKNGANVVSEDIISATSVISDYIKANFPGKTFFALGEAAFIEEITACGLTYCENPGKIDVVIVTLDRALTLHKLEIAAHAISNGARFLAANIDDTCPVEGDEIWDAGSTIAALEKRTHRKLEMHFGKPSQFMIDTIFEKLKLPKEKILLIGDRLETDIQMAALAGVSSVLVRSGVKNELTANSPVQPDYVIDSVADLLPG